MVPEDMFYVLKKNYVVSQKECYNHHKHATQTKAVFY